MNATVTKNAKKGVAGVTSSAGKKAAGTVKPAGKSAAGAAGKSGAVSARAGKTTSKAVADKIAKPKSAKPVSGMAGKAGKAPTAAKPAKSAAAAKTGKAAKESKAIPVASKTAPRSTPAAAKREVSAPASVPTKMRAPKEAPNMEKAAVSKASEVATKTTKSAPAVASDGVLSEAQILKMSDKDYMNAAQLAFFKARLQQLERDLLKNADETTEHLRETVLVPDPADRATIEEEHALELRTRDRERKLLKKVQQSIAAIDAGDYGWCEETGEPIGIPRLLARPTATLSLEAQQRRELKQKLYGD